MSANKQLVGDFYEHAINGRDASVCEWLLSAHFVHNGERRGRDGQRMVVKAFLDAFDPLPLAEAWDQIGLAELLEQLGPG